MSETQQDKTREVRFGDNCLGKHTQVAGINLGLKGVLPIDIEEGNGHGGGEGLHEM